MNDIYTMMDMIFCRLYRKDGIEIKIPRRNKQLIIGDIVMLRYLCPLGDQLDSNLTPQNITGCTILSGNWNIHTHNNNEIYPMVQLIGNENIPWNQFKKIIEVNSNTQYCIEMKNLVQ